MEKQQFGKELNSYISFALKLKPAINFPGHFGPNGKFADQPVHLDLDDGEKLTGLELSNVEGLIEKYKKLKPYLPSGGGLEKLRIVPKEFKQPKSTPGIRYKKVTIHANQLEIAKTVAKKVDEIYTAHSNGDEKKAKNAYNELQKYISIQRSAYLGDFKSIREVEDSLAMFGMGLAHEDNGGAVIFVIIEIFIA
jgi:hypothetical protein